MIFQFKQKSQDFYVSENLPFTLSGEGDAFYVYFEKRNKTTHEVLEHLKRELGLSRMSIGIAGLKDKKAIAKQRVSIYDRALQQAGGEEVFVKTLSKMGKILETGKHEFPLNLSTPITNSFHIRLRSTKNLGFLEREQSIEIIKDLLDKGYANLFGVQRFGLNGRNKTQGREILNRTSKEKFEKKETVFKLQAYASSVFNEIVNKRAKNRKILDGDILTRVQDGKNIYGVYTHSTKTVQECEVKSDSKKYIFYPEGKGKAIPYGPHMMLTCPIPGYNVPLARPSTAAGKLEAEFMARNKLSGDTMGKFKEWKVYGLRRPLRVYPTDTKARYQEDDLLVDFTLPAGSYASIVFDSLGQELKGKKK